MMNEDENKNKKEQYLWRDKTIERRMKFGINGASISLSTDTDQIYLSLEFKFPLSDPQFDVCTVAFSSTISDRMLLELIDYEAEALFQKLVDKTLEKSTRSSGEKFVSRLYGALSRVLDVWSE